MAVRKITLVINDDGTHTIKDGGPLDNAMAKIYRARYLSTYHIDMQIGIAQLCGLKGKALEPYYKKRNKILKEFDAKYPHIKFKEEK